MSFFNSIKENLYNFQEKAEIFWENAVVPKYFPCSVDVLNILNSQSQPIEFHAQYTYTSFEQRRFYLIPPTGNGIFIKDPHWIKTLIYMKRNGEALDVGEGDRLIEQLGKSNMLTCPYATHRRLRTPLESIFQLRHLKDLTVSREIAERMLSLTTDERSGHDLTEHVFLTLIHTILGFEGNSEAFKSTFFESKQTRVARLREFYESRSYAKGKGMDLLQSAQEEGKISEEEKISSTAALFVVGHDTTSTFLEVFVSLMEQQRKYREKIREEWESFVHTRDVVISSKKELLDALILFALGGKNEKGSFWLDSCYLEALRLYPIIPDFRRIVNQEMEIDGYKISKGDEIHLNIQGYHRDEQVWEDAASFIPERFQKEEAHSKLIPFSLGSQHCIGKNLVEVQSKITLVMLSVIFDWKPKKHQIENYLFYNGIAFDLRFTHQQPRSLIRKEWKEILQEIL